MDHLSRKSAIAVLLVFTVLIPQLPADSMGHLRSTGVAGEGVNFSDPLAYEVDYGLMCLLSLYQAEMAWSSENDPEIQATTFLIAALQTVVSVMAGRIALASKPAALLSFTEASAAATAGQSLFSGIVGEIGTELVVEQIGSTLATWAGASPFWAEFVIGEKFGDAMSASKILVSLKNMVYSAVMASQAVVQAAASRIARPSPGVIEAKAIRVLGTAGRNALGVLLEATVETATAARAAGVATPGMAPSMLSALVGSMEQVIADRAANCRGLETARAKFLDAFTGATFADYPGTLLDGHQMAVVMLAAALLHPGAPIVGLLNLPSIRALFGVQPGSGRGHYLQVAVKGVGVYTFRDTGECTLKRADGTVQALDQSPTLLAIALNPNAGPLQFVDPPVESESLDLAPDALFGGDYLGDAYLPVLVDQFAARLDAVPEAQHDAYWDVLDAIGGGSLLRRLGADGAFQAISKLLTVYETKSLGNLQLLANIIQGLDQTSKTDLIDWMSKDGDTDSSIPGLAQVKELRQFIRWGTSRPSVKKSTTFMTLKVSISNVFTHNYYAASSTWVQFSNVPAELFGLLIQRSDVNPFRNDINPNHHRSGIDCEDRAIKIFEEKINPNRNSIPSIDPNIPIYLLELPSFPQFRGIIIMYVEKKPCSSLENPEYISGCQQTIEIFRKLYPNILFLVDWTFVSNYERWSELDPSTGEYL